SGRLPVRQEEQIFRSQGQPGEPALDLDRREGHAGNPLPAADRAAHHAGAGGHGAAAKGLAAVDLARHGARMEGHPQAPEGKVMGWQLVLVLLLMGAGGGFAAGLLGIGGGMVLVPFITMIFSAKGFAPELVVHMAIATSLGTILFTSVSSVRAHHQHGAVLWPVVKLLAPGILVGSWIGPYIGKQMNSQVLALVFSAFVAFSATQMLFNRKPHGSRERPGRGGMFVAGGVIGTVAGLVGAGGGFISVPFMSWCHVRIHNAVATSA